ncbi:chemotaxis protein CheC [Evansella cellulosilytica]|uniref:CheC, inhibitor of MCP methylation n=1 Tax=Evansella cellulosilytica (strain ATCC 21833 / DSM 2522 / FERM P-1141 / JCM 9156 / N-4) TaxID=649639 RepID=E6TSU2_EVAC2|nr:chemotaxis protein CheC [Evansella cellulosilytica]ADU30734.1 CheC, inhibitor of MCP methylation [Evansella cellulosilytica DSM 2522]
MSDYSQIHSQHLDVLKEVGNIGAAHAATALSKLLNKTIDMHVPAVRVVPFHEISEFVGGDEAVVASIFLRIQGEVTGSLFFMLPVNEASILIRHLTKDASFDFSTNEVPEMGISAFNEMGNILAGSYLSALSDFTSLNLQPTPPAFAVDMTVAILSHGLIEISPIADYAIFIDTKISEKDEQNVTQTQGHFFLLPDPDSFGKIFKSLGVTVNE